MRSVDFVSLSIALPTFKIALRSMDSGGLLCRLCVCTMGLWDCILVGDQYAIHYPDVCASDSLQRFVFQCKIAKSRNKSSSTIPQACRTRSQSSSLPPDKPKLSCRPLHLRTAMGTPSPSRREQPRCKSCTRISPGRSKYRTSRRKPRSTRRF